MIRSITIFHEIAPRWRLCGTLLAILVLSGCGGGIHTDYSDLNLKEISGTVRLDGVPIAGAAVLFEAEDKTFSYGTTDASGRYTLQFNSEQSGVLNGPKIVRIGTTLSTGDVEGADDADGSEDGSSGERIPACYNRESVLRVTIDRSTTLNFDLKSDCSTTGPAG